MHTGKIDLLELLILLVPPSRTFLSILSPSVGKKVLRGEVPLKESIYSHISLWSPLVPQWLIKSVYLTCASNVILS